MSYTSTVKLQMQAMDVLYAYKEVSSVLSSVVSMRERADTIFSRIFKETTTLAKHLHGEDFELKQPRLNARQVHRANLSVQSAEEYFRITLYNAFLSHIITELEDSLVLTLKSLVSYSCYQMSVVAEKMTQIFERSLLKLHIFTLTICLTQLCYHENIECGFLNGNSVTVTLMYSKHVTP